MSRLQLLSTARTAACAMLPTAALALHDNMLGSLTAVVDGRSMCPTFNQSGGHDRVVLNRMFGGSVERGDVVVLRSPKSQQQLLIKRIVGVEGDSVQSLSGERLVVPSGQVWVEGDNKTCSQDSRQFGPVDKALVEARVALKVWPLREACIVDREPASWTPRPIRLRSAATDNLLFAPNLA